MWNGSEWKYWHALFWYSQFWLWNIQSDENLKYSNIFCISVVGFFFLVLMIFLEKSHWFSLESNYRHARESNSLVRCKMMYWHYSDIEWAHSIWWIPKAAWGVTPREGFKRVTPLSQAVFIFSSKIEIQEKLLYTVSIRMIFQKFFISISKAGFWRKIQKI